MPTGTAKAEESVARESWRQRYSNLEKELRYSGFTRLAARLPEGYQGVLRAGAHLGGRKTWVVAAGT